jgi:hypothetical protein
MRDALMRLLEPPIEALGFELIELEFAQAGAAGRCGFILIMRAMAPPAMAPPAIGRTATTS